MYTYKHIYINGTYMCVYVLMVGIVYRCTECDVVCIVTDDSNA